MERRRRPRSGGDGPPTRSTGDDAVPPTQPRQLNVCTPQDYAELRQAYRFVPEEEKGSVVRESWQQRMVRRYQSHLYREFVLADLTRYRSGQVGLRWRTKDEVLAGKGFDCCGNKHCPSYGGRADVDAARRASRGREAEDAVRLYGRSRGIGSGADSDDDDEAERREEGRLESLPCGAGIADYEVNFSYVESGETKSELVKLRLCLKCAPMLFYGKGGALGARKARDRASANTNTAKHGTSKLKKEATTMKEERGRAESDDDTVGSSSLDSSRRSRRGKLKKSRRKKRRKRGKDTYSRHRDDSKRLGRKKRRRSRSRSKRGRSRSRSTSSSRQSSEISDGSSVSSTHPSNSGSKTKGSRAERRQGGCRDGRERECRRRSGSNVAVRDDSVRSKTRNQRENEQHVECRKDVMLSKNGESKDYRNDTGEAPSSSSDSGDHVDVDSDDPGAIEAERMLLSNLMSNV